MAPLPKPRGLVPRLIHLFKALHVKDTAIAAESLIPLDRWLMIRAGFEPSLAEVEQLVRTAYGAADDYLFDGLVESGYATYAPNENIVARCIEEEAA